MVPCSHRRSYKLNIESGQFEQTLYQYILSSHLKKKQKQKQKEKPRFRHKRLYEGLCILDDENYKASISIFI